MVMQKIRFGPVSWRSKGLNGLKKPDKKVLEINKVVNMFSKTMKDRPYNDDIDKARTLALLKSLRDVLAIDLPKHRPVEDTWKGTPADKLTFIKNAEQIAVLRESLQKGEVENE